MVVAGGVVSAGKVATDGMSACVVVAGIVDVVVVVEDPLDQLPSSVPSTLPDHRFSLCRLQVFL